MRDLGEADIEGLCLHAAFRVRDTEFGPRKTRWVTSATAAIVAAVLGFEDLRGISDVAQRLHGGRQDIGYLHVIDDSDRSAGIDPDPAPYQRHGAFGFIRTGGAPCGVRYIG